MRAIGLWLIAAVLITYVDSLIRQQVIFQPQSSSMMCGPLMMSMTPEMSIVHENYTSKQHSAFHMCEPALVRVKRSVLQGASFKGT
eukprot:3034257-Karenia_brevis.AAC.1